MMNLPTVRGSVRGLERVALLLEVERLVQSLGDPRMLDNISLNSSQKAILAAIAVCGVEYDQGTDSILQLCLTTPPDLEVYIGSMLVEVQLFNFPHDQSKLVKLPRSRWIYAVQDNVRLLTANPGIAAHSRLAICRNLVSYCFGAWMTE